jgi:GT2 family glycosyltransferase
LGINYVGGLLAVRTQAFGRIGGLSSAYPGAEFHDLLLRIAAGQEPAQIRPIPQILYHWRMPRAGTTVDDAVAQRTRESRRRAVEDHLARRGIDASATLDAAGLVRVKRRLPADPPLVSLIVPTRDNLSLLQPCISGLLERTDYPRFEVIIVDNGSVEARTLAFLETISTDPRVQVLRRPGPFNYSRLNNEAVAQSRGEILGFINNDIEVIRSDWLGEMVVHAMRPEVGAVGAKLLYADGRIQHGGVILGLGGVAGHAHRFFPRAHPGYMHRLRVAHYVSAVTAACLVIDKGKFLAVGGFDEDDFVVTLNDVDLCLKLDSAGYRNLWTPYAELYHKESASRPNDATLRQASRWRRERARCIAKWGPALQSDRYYNPNLSLRSEDFSLP